MQPAVIAISQVTELGTVYTLNEIAALADLAHEHGLTLFVDGARLSNAAAHLDCTLAQMATRTGVDLLTLGGTKNGMLYGEAVVLLDSDLARRARFARKQSGQLASKMRFIAAQFDALLTDSLFLQNARHANGDGGATDRGAGRCPSGRSVAIPSKQTVSLLGSPLTSSARSRHGHRS